MPIYLHKAALLTQTSFKNELLQPKTRCFLTEVKPAFIESENKKKISYPYMLFFCMSKRKIINKNPAP
jgi:hypothetical protein